MSTENTENPLTFVSPFAPIIIHTENPCTDGDPVGWGVFCSDSSGEWIETGFSDEASAERFAEAWTNYKPGNAARVGIQITNNRDQWEEQLSEGPCDYCEMETELNERGFCRGCDAP